MILTEVGQCSRLRKLDLRVNKLTGSWHFVAVMTIYGKRVYQLTEMHPAGSIPTEIGQCSQLEYLYLRENQLTGPWNSVVLIDDKRVFQLVEMLSQVPFRQKLGSALS